MEKYYPYPCDCCGECCKHVELIAEMKDFDRGDGICKYLNNNRCAIYKKRPNICNGKYIYENYFSHMSVEDFHKLMLKYCLKIKKMRVI